VNQFCAELVFKGGDLLADGRLTNSTFPLRQRRSSLFLQLGRKSALHRIYPYRPPYSSMELMLCKE